MHQVVRHFLMVWLVVVFVAVIDPAWGNVVIMGTRIIFPGSGREVTVHINNNGTVASSAQSWVDPGNQDAAPNAINTPFTVMPSITRLDPGKEKILWIVYNGDPLPADRESVFWFNILDEPPTGGAQGSQLQFSFRTRIKLFFRPEGLRGTPEEAIKKLQWSIATGDRGCKLEAKNESPYYVSFSGVTVHSGKQIYDAGAGMVGPRSKHRFIVKDFCAVRPVAATVEATAISDYGGTILLKKAIAAGPN